MAKSRLIGFDWSDAAIAELGVSPQAVKDLAPRMLAVRQEILRDDLRAFNGDSPIPASKRPLDAGFIELSDRLLQAYDQSRDKSELASIISTAKRIRDAVDRVVVIGIGGSYMGARALKDACCQPYFNELSRADRGGCPRMYFAGNNLDNDATQGLLHLLHQPSDGDSGRWGVIVISKSGGTVEPAIAFRVFLSALEKRFGSAALAELVVPVTGATGKLAELADSIGCRDRFLVPDGVGGRFSVLSAVGLLPAAILGLDVVSLLQGAWFMNGHFQSAAPGANVVLDYVAVNHLHEQAGASIRLLSVWNEALESLGLWHDQLLSESIGKDGRGVTPLTVLNTRDLHSRGQQHQEGIRNKIINNLVVENWRCDALPIGHSHRDQDQLNELADKGLPDVMSAAITGTNEAYRGDARPTTTISLSGTDEHSIGQFMQMLMLATVVEGRLIGVNPYGQPGVEQYKTNMNRILRETKKTAGAANAH